MLSSNPKVALQHLDPILTTRRALLLALATVCVIVVTWFVYLLKPEVWLWKNVALFAATHGRSESTSSAALSDRYEWHNLTRDEAIGVIRQFQHKPALRLHTGPSSSPILVGLPAFSFVDADNTYYVSGRCAACFEYVAREDSYEHDPRSKSGLLSKSKVETIALRFAQEHYPHPESLQRVSGSDSGMGPTVYTYLVYFREVTPDGTYGPGECNVGVDRVDGRVIRYDQKYFPILVSTHPQITSAQALKRVEDLMIVQFTQPPLPHRVQLEVSEPDDQGREHLYYGVAVTGFGVQHLTQMLGYIADVDARDGSIYRWHA